MSFIPQYASAQIEQEVPAPLRSDRWGARIAWVVILLCVGLMAWRAFAVTRARDALRNDASAKAQAYPADSLNPTLSIMAKYAVAYRQFFSGPIDPMSANLRSAAQSTNEKMWIVPALGELEGKAQALKEIDKISPNRSDLSTPVARDAAALRTIYEKGPDALSSVERERLIDRLGWDGELALTFGRSEEDSRRHDMLVQAKRSMIGQMSYTGLGAAALLVGLVLLVLTIIWFCQKKFLLRYETPAPPPPARFVPAEFLPTPDSALAEAGMLPQPQMAYRSPGFLDYSSIPAQPPPLPVGGYAVKPYYLLGPLRQINGRTAPFLEAFAIYIAGFIGIGYSLRFVLPAPLHPIGQWVAFLVILPALWWPRFRGISGADWRRGFGWTAGRGVFREMGAGIVAYITGIPIFALAAVITYALLAASKTHSYHPISDEVTAGSILDAINLLLLAAVAAPVIEETFFRGALFHHLRGRWSWIVSTLLSSLIFAAIHPQGWAVVPALASLAIIFCCMREWRSSSIASMTAHAIHNGLLVMMLLLSGM